MSNNQNENFKKNKIFKEIFLKGKIENNIFRNYFNINKDEYTIINSFLLPHNTEDNYIISGFLLMNILGDNKIKFNLLAEDQKYKVLGFNIDKSIENKLPALEEEIDKILEFYFCDENKIKQKLFLKNIFIFKELEFFFKKFSKYFTEIVTNFFLKFFL